jgi:hypothetical protein
MKSLQETYAPNNRCFGCGPSNEQGLRIRSFESGDEVVCDWTPQPHHLAFNGIVNGGIIGAILDCHSNWTAAVHLMKKNALDELPATVTSDFHVTLKRPTPILLVQHRSGQEERRKGDESGALQRCGQRAPDVDLRVRAHVHKRLTADEPDRFTGTASRRG